MNGYPTWVASQYNVSVPLRTRGRFTIAANTIFCVKDYCESTVTGNGYGIAINHASENEIYLIGMIRKVA